MKIADFKGKKITVMGLGLHGGAVAAIRFLSEAGAVVTVTDIKSREELAPSVEKLKDCKNITFVLNQHRPEDFTKADMIVKNPGASWNNKYIKMATANNIPVEMDSSLFFKLTDNNIIGITGTKGKTTTATLIYEILKTARKEVVKAGVGQVSVLDKIKSLKKETIVVFELSSWRLSALGHAKISPKIAVITNVYQDHLNYYKSMEEYISDKKFIFTNQKKGDCCIINVDNKIVRNFEPEIKSQIVRFSTQKIDGGKSIYANDNAIYFNDGLDEKKIIDVSDVKVKGSHNLENVLAAVAAALTLKIDPKDIRKAVRNFSGVASHRLEFVRELHGVKYYNDTASTAPESTIRGIESFWEPVILIAGGADKNLDVADLGKVIAQKVKEVIFLEGSATEKIISAIKYELPSEKKNNTEFRMVDSMEKAVELARSEAQAGEVVLLSPAAASFGMFKNEFDRGDKFKEAVNGLK